MALRFGIIGLPNVGKSTLFNALTSSSVPADNYPFTTIKPNMGIVSVPDERLKILGKSYPHLNLIPATIEVYDIAGLVKGASSGEGLGNQFLAQIRESDAIIEVVRCFEGDEIIHVEHSVDPLRDSEIIELELIMADLETLSRRHKKVATKARVEKEPTAVYEFNLIKKLIEHLQKGEPARTLPDIYPNDREYILKQFHLISAKPHIYVANVESDDETSLKNNTHYQSLREGFKHKQTLIIPVAIKLESELALFDESDRQEYISLIDASGEGINELILSAYKLLNLATFFTIGDEEIRAWTFTNGQSARECAGLIHTDFERGFIKAEIFTFTDFVTYGSEQAIKETGKLNIEGKDYLIKDGDIAFFKFNVTK